MGQQNDGIIGMKFSIDKINKNFRFKIVGVMVVTMVVQGGFRLYLFVLMVVIIKWDDVIVFDVQCKL